MRTNPVSGAGRSSLRMDQPFTLWTAAVWSTRARLGLRAGDRTAQQLLHGREVFVGHIPSSPRTTGAQETGEVGRGGGDAFSEGGARLGTEITGGRVDRAGDTIACR